MKMRLRKKRMKLLAFTLHFCLKRLRGINNDKNDNEYNSKNTRQNNNYNSRSNRIWKVKVKPIGVEKWK